MSSGTVVDESIKKRALDKLLGQEANTIVLIAILVAIGAAFWWAMTTGIPAHLSQIQAGYERLDDRHEKARIEDRTLFKETLDRIERRGTLTSKD